MPMPEPAPKRLLIVDDEAEIRKLIREVAEPLGWTVSEAANGEELMNCINSVNPDSALYRDDFDVVMLDLVMPKTDGIEIIRYLAARGSSANVILMSGYDSLILNAAKELAVARGIKVLGALEKPFQIRDLESLLDNIKHARPAAPSLQTGGEPPSADELRAAISNNEIEVHYQPKVNIATLKLVGFEALARWRHPVKGMILPGLFVPVAEKNGLIEPLTLAVMDRALEQCGKWNQGGLAVKVAINFSALTMTDLDFPNVLLAKAALHGLSPSQVVVELTESSVVETMAAALDIFTRLRMKGFCLSIDDFGTGYSSMQQLQKIPFNEIKIDQSCVSAFDRNIGARSIIESTVALGHKLRMTVVAEGVETQACLDFLGSLGCQEAQGYFIGKPMPVDRVESWLREWNP